MDPKLIEVLSGVSTLLGLLSLLAFFYLHLLLNRAERSVQELIGGENLFNAKQVLIIIEKFHDEQKRLEALKTLTAYDKARARDLLDKVKNNVDVHRLSLMSLGRYHKIAAICAAFFLVLAGIAYLADRSGRANATHDEPDVSIVPDPIPDILATINVVGKYRVRRKVSDVHKVTETFHGKNQTVDKMAGPGQGWSWDLSVPPTHEQGGGKKGECVPPSFSGATDSSVTFSARLEEISRIGGHDPAYQTCTLIATRYRWDESEEDFELGPFELLKRLDRKIELPSNTTSFRAAVRTYDGRDVLITDTGGADRLFSASVRANALVFSPTPPN